MATKLTTTITREADLSLGNRAPKGVLVTLYPGGADGKPTIGFRTKGRAKDTEVFADLSAIFERATIGAAQTGPKRTVRKVSRGLLATGEGRTR